MATVQGIERPLFKSEAIIRFDVPDGGFFLFLNNATMTPAQFDIMMKVLELAKDSFVKERPIQVPSKPTQD